MRNLDETERFILCYLCIKAGIPYNNVMKTRKRERVEVRQVFMKWLKEVRGYSLKTIAKKINLKDHTTVIHGLKTVDIIFEEKPKLKNAYETACIRYRGVS